MKAILHTKFGSTRNLRLEEIVKPKPKPDEVLIKIAATAVNSWDWDMVIGKPIIYRLLFGFFKPRIKVIGCDVAGTIEAVGVEVKDFKVGDTVFGDLSQSSWGGFAEYTTAKTKYLSLKPDDLSFEEAASLPQAGLLALQGLRFNGAVKPGAKILFNGAGGGVGTIGVQIAKHWGAEVTAVDSGEKLAMLSELGADHVIDYKTEDFTKQETSYDLIIDVVANHSSKAYTEILNVQGALAIIGGKPGTLFTIAINDLLFGKKKNKRLGVVPHKLNTKEQDELLDFINKGKLKPVIDTVYPLSKTAEAIQHVGDGRVMGKVIVVM